MIFQTLRDSSLKNVLQNGVNSSSKLVFNNPLFLSKNRFFLHFETYDLVQCSPACKPNTYQLMYGETRLPVSAFATVAKFIFRSTFYVTITDAAIESLKSIHTLFDKHVVYMLVKFE